MSNQNDWLLLTGGDEWDISFYVLDIKTKDIVYKKTKQKELSSLPPEKGRPLFRPFGITTDDKFIYLASNDRIGMFNKSTFGFVKLLDIPAFINTHQIIKHDNFLFICHTAINCIGIHDLETKTNKFIKMPATSTIAPSTSSTCRCRRASVRKYAITLGRATRTMRGCTGNPG